VKSVTRKLVTATTIAVAAALVLGGARVAGIDVWKILLALVGWFIFRAASAGDAPEVRASSPRRPDQ
jgi:hypothetical protein